MSEIKIYPINTLSESIGKIKHGCWLKTDKISVIASVREEKSRVGFKSNVNVCKNSKVILRIVPFFGSEPNILYGRTHDRSC